MFILSFDIGIKNLAYCYFEFCKAEDTLHIIDWNILDISVTDKTKQSKKILETLEEKFKDSLIDHVLVENQPALVNPIMKTIQVIIHTYFEYNKLFMKKEYDVHIINARSKLKSAKTILESYNCPEITCKTAPSNKYKWNKEASILYTKQFLEHKCLDEHLDFFKTFKKKDDLADTLLQGLYFVHLPGTTESTSSA